MRKLAISILSIMLVSACGVHNPYYVGSPTESKPNPSATSYPPHTNPVRLAKDALPPGTNYEVLETIDVGKGSSYGGDEEAEKLLADRARAIGADAVILMKLWHQPSGWSWAAPHGSGQAVKLADPRNVDLGALPGGWF